jgi:methylthioribose-1-phosphate isomerase
MADRNIMSYETVALDDDKSALVILDQTKLPYEVEVLSLTEQKDIWNAIYLLQVRGAPAIGVAAGFGVYLAAKRISAHDYEEFYTNEIDMQGIVDDMDQVSNEEYKRQLPD